MGHSWNALALNLVVWLFYLQPLHPRQVSSHKVGGSEMVTIFQVACFSYDVKHDVSMRWLVCPNKGHSHFPHDFWSLYANI
jgi:hypothetical protein